MKPNLMQVVNSNLLHQNHDISEVLPDSIRVMTPAEIRKVNARLLNQRVQELKEKFNQNEMRVIK